MRPIGGYFELELSCDRHFPHQEGALVNSGRCALEYLLMGIGDVRHLYVPYYTCEVVFEPIKSLGIEYSFYHIDENLEIAEIPELTDGEYIIVNNYFGIKDTYIEQLCYRLSGHVIVDNSQAFFTPQYNGQPTFWSPRKFVGVPDGGIAVPKYSIAIDGKDESYDRCSHLLKRWDLGAQGGYGDFNVNRKKLKHMPILQMSELTRALLMSIDYKSIIEKRNANYMALREALEGSNGLKTPDAESVACPMVYPYFTDDKSLRKRLIENRVFVATYWPNVFDWCKESDLEYRLASQCLPLPIDQRYGKEEMQAIIELIKYKAPLSIGQ